jgi:hypothetical protein
MSKPLRVRQPAERERMAGRGEVPFEKLPLKRSVWPGGTSVRETRHLKTYHRFAIWQGKMRLLSGFQEFWLVPDLRLIDLRPISAGGQ